ncbi:phenolphthiocerol synthesis polyketide synthase type I Pks15/1 [Biomphalaria glabrata]
MKYWKPLRQLLQNAKKQLAEKEFKASQPSSDVTVSWQRRGFVSNNRDATVLCVKPGGAPKAIWEMVTQKSYKTVADADPPIYPDKTIETLECCGHVQKRMGR